MDYTTAREFVRANLLAILIIMFVLEKLVEFLQMELVGMQVAEAVLQDKLVILPGSVLFKLALKTGIAMLGVLVQIISRQELVLI